MHNEEVIVRSNSEGNLYKLNIETEEENVPVSRSTRIGKGKLPARPQKISVSEICMSNVI